MVIFNPLTWINRSTPINEANMNRIEKGVDDCAKAINSKLGELKLFQDENGRYYIQNGEDESSAKKLGSSEGTATTDQVLSGATFNSASTPDSDDFSTGTMPNRGDVVFSDASKTTLTKNYGYYKSLKIDYSKAYDLGSPNSVSVADNGTVTVTKNDSTKWRGSISNNYDAAKSQYNPASATLTNDGALTVKNSSGSAIYTANLYNNYDVGKSHRGLAGWINVAASSANGGVWGGATPNYDDCGLFDLSNPYIINRAEGTNTFRIFYDIYGVGQGDGYQVQIHKNGNGIQGLMFNAAYTGNWRGVVEVSLNKNDYIGFRCSGSFSAHNFGGTVLIQLK